MLGTVKGDRGRVLGTVKRDRRVSVRYCEGRPRGRVAGTVKSATAGYKKAGK